ncbi:MAG TPA: polysaccharide biosynthesis tyrosine autokinase, partial [Chthoniobacterales bacterium]
IEQNLLSPALVQTLIHQPELSSDPAFLPRIPRPAADERLRLALAGEISASLRRGTRLIDITAEDESPHVAQKIADLLVQEFLRSNAHTRRGIAQQAQGYLEREAERLKGKLASSETLLQEYKEAHRAVSLDARQNIVVERLKELNGKVTAAKGERLKLETDRAQIQALAGQPSEHLLALPSIASADEVVEFRRKITEKENEIVAMGYSPSHPRRVQVAAEVSELKIAIRGAIAKAAQRISTSLEAAQITETKLEEALRAQEELALELSKMAIPYESLAREVEADRAFYNSLLARMKEVQVGQGIAQDVVHVVAPALLPERPSKPRKALVLLLSGCAGVALGLTLALGSTLLDGTIRTVDQAEEVLGLRPLAAIPMGSRVALRRARMLLIDNAQSVMADTFRALRTAVQFAAPQEGLRTVLFTSSVPQEGKSFCAVNYAVALAQQGYRTLLIDADLRLPSLAKAFFGREQPAGLSDIFLGESDLDNSVSLTNVENLSILPAGQPVRHPAELVARASFTDLLANVLQRFDRVVIDSAPIHAVSETLIIAAQVQGVCLIVRAGKTRGAVVRRALQRLHEAGAHVPGFVLNGVPARSKGYFYHYQAPGYGRDEVYGASRAKRLRRAS